MFLPNSIIVKLKKKYKSNSIISINNNMKRIFRDGLNEKKFNKKMLIDRFPLIKKYISRLEKISVQKVMIHNIRSIIGLGDERYNKLVKTYNSKLRQINVPIRVKKVYMTLEDIGKKVLNFDMKSMGNAVKMLVSSIYKYLPPIRGQDIYNTKIYKFRSVQTKDKYIKHLKVVRSNYLDISNWYLIIGTRVLKINKTLKLIIKRWIEISKIKSSDYLLINREKKKFKQDAFTKMLWRIYGNNFGTDMIRGIYIYEIIYYLESLGDNVNTIRWRSRLAHMVGHSIEAQEHIYRTFKSMKKKRSPLKYMKEIYNNMKDTYVK